MGNSPPSSQHWKRWATALRQEYSVRPKPAIPCAASDCSSWPSARAEDSESSGKRVSRGVSDTLTAAARDWPSPMAGSPAQIGNSAAGDSDFSRKAMELAEGMLANWPTLQARDHFPDYVAAKKAEGHGMRNLNDEAADWRSPTDISKRGGSQPPAKRIAGDHTVNLEDQAEHWPPAQTWPAPAARDHKGSSEASTIRQDGKVRSDMLDYAAEQFFQPPSSLPPSFPDPAIAAGALCSTDSPNTNQPSARRKLNPIFVEALMRWPTGLSGFERQETALTRWGQLMPSYLSALCCAAPADQQDLFA